MSLLPYSACRLKETPVVFGREDCEAIGPLKEQPSFDFA
jgi:hypothetical protein